jgi:hypothetical protein
LKFALVTAHNEAYQPLADITWNQNKKVYCEKWGYDALAMTSGFQLPVQHISFERSNYIADLLESGQYDWIHAVGCDTMITNFNIKLEDLIDDDFDFVIATDCYNINNDSFLARASDTTIKWLRNTVSLYESYINAKWLDQSAMIDTIDMMGDRIKIVPQRALNSYNYDLYPGLIPHIYKKDLLGNDGQWQPGDFLIHWPAVPLNKRIELAQQMLGQVVQ